MRQCFTYYFIFWAFWILVAALAFKDSIDCGRCRLTDKQQKELDALYDKWEREEQEEEEEEEGKQKGEKP
ncbi:MAG: hypothetical protein L6V92_05990 [Phocaeicola vulgatus]|nr:MAG: hypothetical protein L6V92_05990 [Phocaeicola vulgatus]